MNTPCKPLFICKYYNMGKHGNDGSVDGEHLSCFIAGFSEEIEEITDIDVSDLLMWFAKKLRYEVV